MSHAVRRQFLPLVLGALVGIGVFAADSLFAVSVTDIGTVVLVAGLSLFALALPALLRRYPLAVSITLLGGALRALLFKPTPTVDDGPFYLFTAEQFLRGELVAVGHAASDFIWAVFVVLFSTSALNVASLVFATATIPVAGLVAWRLFDSPQVGAAAMAAFAVAPLHIYHSVRAMNEPLALFFFGVTLYAIVTDRLGAATALTVAVAFMRIEYAAAFLVPLLLYRAIGHRSGHAFVRPLLLFGPLGLVCVLLVTDLFGLDTSVLLRAIRFAGRLDLFSPVSIVTILRNPIETFGQNYQVVGSHMSHWGVPYWNRYLANPLLPVLAVGGVVLVAPRSLRTVSAGALTMLGFWVVLLQGEVAAGSLALSLLTFVLSISAFSALAVRLYRADTAAAEPFLFAYVYSLVLVFLPSSGRYVLPVVFVLSLYAGVALERTVATAQRTNRTDPATVAE